MAVDLSVFDRLKTKQDFDRLEEEFQLRRQAALKTAQGSTPAAIQIANEYAKARAAGDTQRMNDIAIAAKSFDKGVVYDQMGNPVAMGGYGDAVGSIAGTKKAYEANAQNASDLYYDPQIKGAETAADLQQQQIYKPALEQDIAQRKANVEIQTAEPIAAARKTGEVSATQIGDLQKKADQASSMTGLTDQAREILMTGKPTGSYLGAIGAFGKRLVGISDENTQANKALDVIAGNLTGNVPRFEGPQSDADRKYYIQMAGQVNDITLPEQDRLAALAEIDKLNAKYANVQTPAKQIIGTPKLSGNIPMGAVQYLKANPQYRDAFDQKYGAGASNMVLGK